MLRHLKTTTLATAAAVAVTAAHAQDTDEGLARAAERLAVYTQQPVFTPPGEAFDIRACVDGQQDAGNSEQQRATRSSRASSTG